MRIPLVALAGLACADPSARGAPAGPSVETSDPAFPARGPDLVADDRHVNHLSSDWLLPVTPVAAQGDAFVYWDDVEADAYGVARDPTSYDLVLLLRASVGRGELEDALEIGRPDGVIDGIWSGSAAGETSARLSDLTQAGAAFDPALLVADPDQSWLVALADDGTVPELRTGLLLVPDAAQAGVHLDLPSAGARVDFASSFDGDPLKTDAGHPEYTLDFGAITVDAYGLPVPPVDTLFIGAYTGRDEADDLANDVYDLAAPAAEWWTIPLDGATAVSLSEATGTDGAFPGFATDRVYVVGATCAACWSPAPSWVLTVEVGAR